MASANIVDVTVADSLMKELIVHFVEHNNYCLVLRGDSFLLAD
jgi:hypothetical protein